LIDLVPFKFYAFLLIQRFFSVRCGIGWRLFIQFRKNQANETYLLPLRKYYYICGMKAEKSDTRLLNSFFGVNETEKVKELFYRVDTPLFSRKDTGLTHRNLNLYIKEGAVSDEVNFGSKYSFVSFMWVKITEQLRKIGVPLPVIKIYRENICAPFNRSIFTEQYEKAKEIVGKLKGSKVEKETVLISLRDKALKEADQYPFSLLHIAIIDTFIHRKPFSIAFFPDGTYLPVLFDKERFFHLGESEREKLMFQSCALISLTGIMKDFFKLEISAFTLPELKILDENTSKLIELIHSGKYDSITVNFKDKKMKSLELHKAHDTKEKIVDILAENEFQDITIKKHKGIITKIENKVKMLFDE
jgi:hypothetical protein